jgi:hypothetical protein
MKDYTYRFSGITSRRSAILDNFTFAFLLHLRGGGLWLLRGRTLVRAGGGRRAWVQTCCEVFESLNDLEATKRYVCAGSLDQIR